MKPLSHYERKIREYRALFFSIIIFTISMIGLVIVIYGEIQDNLLRTLLITIFSSLLAASTVGIIIEITTRKEIEESVREGFNEIIRSQEFKQNMNDVMYNITKNEKYLKTKSRDELSILLDKVLVNYLGNKELTDAIRYSFINLIFNQIQTNSIRIDSRTLAEITEIIQIENNEFYVVNQTFDTKLVNYSSKEKEIFKNGVMKVAITNDSSIFNQLLNNEDYTMRFFAHVDIEKLKIKDNIKDYFDVLPIKIGDNRYEAEIDISKEKIIEFSTSCPEKISINAEIKFHSQIKILIPKQPLYFIIFPFLTKDAEITFSHPAFPNKKIFYRRFLSINVKHDPPIETDLYQKHYVSGWIFPGSGIVFTWKIE